MENVHIIYGAGYGKTAAAMGLAVKAAGAGETVTIVQFLKGTDANYSILSQFDVVILDEVLGLMDYNILYEEDFEELLAVKSPVKLILTGRNCPAGIKRYATMISKIEPN